MKVSTIDEREGFIFDVCWHPSGNYIAVSGADGKLKIFEQKENNFVEIVCKQRERAARRAQFSPNGTKIVVAGFDEHAIVYSFDPKLDGVLSEEATLSGQDAEIKTARWSPKADLIVTASRDKSVWVWDTEEYDFIAVHSEHTADVKDAMFSPDGKFIVSVSFDEKVKVWEAKEELGSLQTFSHHQGTVWSLAFNPNNGNFITLGEDGKIILYKLDKGSYQIAAELQLQGDLESLYTAYYLDGQWFVGGSQTKIFVVAEDLSKINRTIPIDQMGDINCIAAKPGFSNLVAVGNDDGTVSLFDIEKSK